MCSVFTNAEGAFLEIVLQPHSPPLSARLLHRARQAALQPTARPNVSMFNIVIDFLCKEAVADAGTKSM
jgi:hypothetical protein